MDAFDSPVKAFKLQSGCVRYSYLPYGSKIPSPFKCVCPKNKEEEGMMQPIFRSLQFGEAGYAELHQKCPIGITQGSDAESEMGAYHNLYQSYRIKNLEERLTEYLPFNLEGGIFL